jgi:myosin heavy subunit
MKDLLLKLNQLSNVTLYVCGIKDKKMNTVHDGAIFEADTPPWMQSFVAGDKMILVFEQKGQRKQYFRWKLDEDTYAIILDDTQHTSLNLLLNALLTAMSEGFKAPEIILPDPSLPDIKVLQEKITQLTETLEEERAKAAAAAEEAAKHYSADLEAKINQYVEEFEAKAQVQVTEFEEALTEKTREAEENITRLTKELDEEKKKSIELSAAETSVKQSLSELEKTVAELKEQNTDQAARLKDTLAKNLELTHQINELTAAAQKGIAINTDSAKVKEDNIRLLAQIQDWEQRFRELNNKYNVLQKQAEAAKVEAAPKVDPRRPLPKQEPKPQPQPTEEVLEESGVEVSQTEGDKKATEIHIHINQPAQQAETKPAAEAKKPAAGIRKGEGEVSHPHTVKSSPATQHLQASKENRGLVEVVQALTAIITSGDASHIDLAKLGQFVSVPSKSDLERNPAAVKTVIAKLLGMERSGQLNDEQIAKLKEAVS